jgi:6-phospho-3-hexuloisomerase
MNFEKNLSAIRSEIDETLSRISSREVDLLRDSIGKAERIFCAGAGRSGLVMRTFAMRLMQMGFQAFVVGETITPAITGKDLLIIGSGSGETGSLLTMAHKAKDAGAPLVLLTVLPGSSIGSCADVTVAIPATTPKARASSRTRSVQSKGSLFEQSMFLLLEAVVLSLMQQRGFDPDSIMTRHANLE